MTRDDDPTADPEYIARLRDFGVESLASGSILRRSTSSLVRGWCTALDRAVRRPERLAGATRSWLEETLGLLASQYASDALRSRAAEVEAALRLSLLGVVLRVPEARKARTVDFTVFGLNVEVFCPQEHTAERAVTDADLAKQLDHAEGPVCVAVTISHPTTGSGRTIDKHGAIRRDPENLALVYPANKLIDRLLHKKRDGAQFLDGEQNVLWLDLKHGLGFSAIDCVPYRSMVAKGTCFTGTHGIWHAFYGEFGSPLLKERTALEWSVSFATYGQQAPGWFRALPKVSAAVLSVLDGILLFENPWANTPLTVVQRGELARLSDLRPELSWSNWIGTLERDVESTLMEIGWLAQLTRAEHEQAQH